MNVSEASVVLTGAAGGLGSAIARRLYAQGARLLLVGRSAEPLLALAQSLSAGATDRAIVDALVVDITTEAGRTAIADAAAARRANILINNAAVAAFGPAADLDPTQARRLFETNVLAPMLLIAQMLPQLETRPKAQVLNIGSVLGSLGVPGFSAYGASKAALRAYTEALRRELADTSVIVQYFAPRAIDTPFNSPEVVAFNQATGSHSDAPEVVARAVQRLLERGSAQCFAGGVEALAVRLNALSPLLLDSTFIKHRRALTSSFFKSGASS